MSALPDIGVRDSYGSQYAKGGDTMREEPQYARADVRPKEAGLMDQLEEGLNRLSSEIEILEARTAYVRTQGPESELAVPERAGENTLDNEVIRLNRYVNRLAALNREIRL